MYSDIFPHRIYALPDVIHLTSLSRITTWKKIKDGKFRKCSNTGRRVLISAHTLEEFLGVRKGEYI